MADGILKSDPDEIWNYYISLNKNREYIEDAIKDIERAFNSQQDRITQKRSYVMDKQTEWKRKRNFLMDKRSQAKDEKELNEIQCKIEAAQRKLKKLEQQEEELCFLSKKIPEYLQKIKYAEKRCFRSISGAKRILNAYLKMIEIHTVQTNLQEYGYSGTPGRYGVMNYRNTTFYCDGSAFAPTSDNISRMECGNAPVGYDGKPVELHHMIQSENGGIIEIPGSRHKADHKTLHINTADIPSGINRQGFQVLRTAYWKRRAEILKKEMGHGI